MDKDQTDLIAKLNAAITAWKSEVTGAQERLARQIVTASNHLDTLAGILSGHEGPAASDDVAARMDSLERELAARQEAAEQAERRATELEHTCAELLAEAERLGPFEEKAQALEEELRQLRETAQASSGEIDQARARIAALEQVQSESALATQRTVALESEIRDLHIQESEARGAAVQMAKEAESLRNAAESSATRLLDLQAENEAGRKLLEEARTALRAAEEAVAASEAECAALKDARVAQDEEREVLRTQAERDGEALKATRAEVATLKEALAGKDRMALAATQHIVQLGQTITRLEHELDVLREAQSDEPALRTELAALQAKLEAQTQTIRQMEETPEVEMPLEDLTGRSLMRILPEPSELEQEVLRLGSEVESLRTANEQLESRIRDMDAAQEVRKRQGRIALAALDAEGRPRRMGEILVAAGRITREQLADALGEQKQISDRLLGAILMEKEYADEHDIAQVVASQLHVPFMVVAEDTVSTEAAALVDGAFCAQRVCVPLSATPDLLVLAMANPLDSATIDRIQAEINRRVLPVVATPSDISAALDRAHAMP